jgi:hypothetical protein
MNLKLMAAPLLVLSLASTSALAAVQQSSANSNTVSTGSNQMQQFTSMNNDAPAAKVNMNFLNNVKFGGYLAVDAFGQSDENYLGASSNTSQNSQSGVALSAAALNVADQINNWIGADLNLFAANGPVPVGYSGEAYGTSSDAYKTQTRYYTGSTVRSGVDIDEAYIDVANFAQSPVALRAGQFYLPYGQYDRYAIAPTLTQQMTEIREDALEVAYVNTNGLHGSVYGFKGIPVKTNDNANTLGASLGYTTSVTSNLGVDLGAGYISNVLNIGSVADVANDHSISKVNKTVGGWDAYVTGMSGPFSLGLQYTAFGTNIHTGDLTKSSTNEAKPDAGTITGTYASTVQGYATKLTADYGWTDNVLLYNASNVYTSLPKNRVGAEYDVNVLTNTMVSAEVHYDKAYNTNEGGTGNHSLTGTVRLAVML